MQKNSKIFLLDTMALVYRAHFGMIKNPRFTSKGFNTAAIYGFTNTLMGLIERNKPTHIGAAMDCATPTFRHIASEDYKSHRESQPEDITIAMPYIRKILDAFNIKILELEGYEADDIIGTVTRQAVADDCLVYLMSSDKDFAQLLTTTNVFLYRPGIAKQEIQILGQKDILSNWGIDNVEQVCDILGLQGDASDNISGVPKIGAKTASKLIKTYGSIENLLQNTHELKGSIRETLERHAELAISSKELATICTSVPMSYTYRDLVYTEYDEQKLKSLFIELEFRSLLNKLFNTSIHGSSLNKPSEISLFRLNDEGNRVNSIQSINHQYKILDVPDEINSSLTDLCNKKEISFFLDSADNTSETHDLLGIAMGYDIKHIFYIPIHAIAANTKIKESLRSLFESERVTKISYDIRSSIYRLRKHNIFLKEPFFDISIAHHLMIAEAPRGLTPLAQNYLGYILMSQHNDESINDLYSCERASVILQLQKKMHLELQEQKLSELFFNIEMPVSQILVEMESNGVRIDINALSKISSEMESELTTFTQSIHKLANEDFNIASPKQLGIVLFEKLKLISNPKKTPSGQYMTNDEVLQGLASQNIIVQKILEYRELQKLKSTYVDALPRLISKEDGLLHTTYNQSVVITGRLSSSSPNLQNIPIRTARGREIRKAFIARSEDNMLITVDYSQIELRVMAHLSQDPTMMQAFHLKKDIHAATASKIFNVAPEDVNTDMRRKAKTANFGIIYGISPFGLAKRLNISKSEALEIIEAYFKEFPYVKQYMDNTISLAKQRGYVSTLMGRRQYLRDINSLNSIVRGHAERNAINMPIQGSAAELMKIAMVDITKWIKLKYLKTKMIMQVHDELVFDAPLDEIELIKKDIPSLMTNAMQLHVPIEVKLSIGKNWLEVKEMDKDISL
jgi:DNA polymerase-1